MKVIHVMTKVNMQSNARAIDNRETSTTTTRNKSRTKTIVEPRNIALKTIHDDIMRDNANATITTKKMRVWLRANARDFAHAHNASWTFNQHEYNIVRAQFDVKYASKIERASKRNTQSNDAPKKTRNAKRETKMNDAPIVAETNA